VGFDVRFLTLLLSSRFAHLPTRAGPQQQQWQSIEMEELRFIEGKFLYRCSVVALARKQFCFATVWLRYGGENLLSS
jgi:hypothetical protein